MKRSLKLIQDLFFSIGNFSKIIIDKAAERHGSKSIGGGSTKSEKLARLKSNYQNRIFLALVHNLECSLVGTKYVSTCIHASGKGYIHICASQAHQRHQRCIHCRLVGVPSCCNNSHYRKGRLLTMISDSVHRTLESEEDRTISQSGFLDTVRCSIAITLYYISLLSGLGNICSIGQEPPIGLCRLELQLLRSK